MLKLQRSLTVILSTVLAGVFVASLSGCNVAVDKKSGGDAKKVDISTPFGDIKVDKQADARDTGLPVYPNSRQKKEDDSNDSKSANVNMSFGKFGLKVVAATYEVDDAPDKVLKYYQSELGKYGSVLQCKGGTIGNVNVDHTNSDKDLHCDSHGSSDVTELKVGSKDLQRVVAVKPSGKGSEYSLVYVRTSGTEKEPI